LEKRETKENNMYLIVRNEQQFKSLRREKESVPMWLEKPKASSVPIKRDQPHEQKSERIEGTKRAAHVSEKEADHFSGGFTALGLYTCVCVCVCVYARAPVNSTAKSLEFHFCLPAGEHYRSFCRRCEGFLDRRCSLRISSTPRPQTIFRESKEAVSLIGWKGSSVDI